MNMSRTPKDGNKAQSGSQALEGIEKELEKPLGAPSGESSHQSPVAKPTGEAEVGVANSAQPHGDTGLDPIFIPVSEGEPVSIQEGVRGPAPREGMDQKWGRYTGANGEIDISKLRRDKHDGKWNVRHRSTLREDEQHFCMGQAGNFLEGAVVYRNLVLMERSISISEEVARVLKERRLDPNHTYKEYEGVRPNSEGSVSSQSGREVTAAED